MYNKLKISLAGKSINGNLSRLIPGLPEIYKYFKTKKPKLF